MIEYKIYKRGDVYRIGYRKWFFLHWYKQWIPSYDSGYNRIWQCYKLSEAREMLAIVESEQRARLDMQAKELEFKQSWWKQV